MITKEYASYSKLKTELTNIALSLKEPFGKFYREHIGDIDKNKPISLDDYIVMQDETPLGTATIKLEKNRYILQKEQKNGEYLYIPFEKKQSPIIPSSNSDIMKMLYSKYTTFKSYSKKQLLEKIYNKNLSKIKEAKITKNSFFSDKLENLAVRLEDIGVNDLSQALMYYDVVEVTSKRLRRNIPDEVVVENPYFDKVEKLKDSIPKLESHDALLLTVKLLKEVEKKYDSLNVSIIKDITSYKEDSYISVSLNEEISCMATPKSDFILDQFFKKDIDKSKLKRDIYGGRVGIEMKISFSFYEPCSNLSEVMDRFSSIGFARSVGAKLDYNIDEAIQIR